MSGRITVLLLVLLVPALQAQDEQQAVADVVVIVDTSTSMREAGMDPERTSLLVAKLLTDIVPGELAVVRLLDMVADKTLIPSQPTGETRPCAEDPNRDCQVMEPSADWNAEARANRLGAKIRPSRADLQFKSDLDRHLEQRINNSLFSLAFSAAQGVFDARPGPDAPPKTVVWLSDGRADDPIELKEVVRDLQDEGVRVEAIVFGRGQTALAEEAALNPLRVSTPAELMKAFAGAFRRMVRAPYEVDQLVSSNPTFEMKPHVDEAWVVVYGDETLGDVALDGPQGSLMADYAQDNRRRAGAYRAAYIRKPTPGSWTVRITGGGAGAAYAVVQRSALTPVLLDPSTALAGTEVALTAALRAGLDGDLVDLPDLLAGLTIEASHEGKSVRLSGDASGRFRGSTRFENIGDIPVRLHAVSPLVDREGRAVVQVTSSFSYQGEDIEIDLGTIGLEEESCRALLIQAAEHKGTVQFELELLESLPGGHLLELRTPSGTLRPDSDSVGIAPGDNLQVCLLTDDQAPISTAQGEPWLRLKVSGSQDPGHRVDIRLHWQVNGLTFWQRWGWLILLILLLLLIAIIVAGYIVPERFSGALAVTFVPDRDELEEQTPQPVKQWKGTGIGFYRNARAYLHSNYRLSGNAKGALAGLMAEKGGLRVVPGRGGSLCRETLDGAWEAVASGGRRARSGDVYRSGESGPYFRISTRTGR